MKLFCFKRKWNGSLLFILSSTKKEALFMKKENECWNNFTNTPIEINFKITSIDICYFFDSDNIDIEVEYDFLNLKDWLTINKIDFIDFTNSNEIKTISEDSKTQAKLLDMFKEQI